MMQDVRRALRQAPTLRVLAIQDAAPEMWNRLRAALDAEPSVTAYDELIDHYHAMQHLQTPANAIDDDARTVMARWKAMLRQSADAIDIIHAEITAESKSGYRPDLRIILEDLPREQQGPAPLRNPAGGGLSHRLRRHGRRRQIRHRLSLQRSGSRWRPPVLRSVLACRDVLLNDRLPSSIRILRRQDCTADVRQAG